MLGRGDPSYICLGHYLFRLESIVFMVCEYMNAAPVPQKPWKKSCPLPKYQAGYATVLQHERYYSLDFK